MQCLTGRKQQYYLALKNPNYPQTIIMSKRPLKIEKMEGYQYKHYTINSEHFVDPSTEAQTQSIESSYRLQAKEEI